MAILKTFLCVCNTRTGSLICGCYTLTISLVCLVYYLFRYVGHKIIEDSPEYKGIVYGGFVLYGFMIVTSLVIIPGVQLDKRYLLLPWIYVMILVVLYDTGSVALLTTVHLEREKTLQIWEIVWVFFYCIRLATNCYCFTCVVSQYQELAEGRGTYDYFYKQHRRARLRRQCRQFDFDTYDLPFGVHLPPYIQEDETDNNPPLYEKIYPESAQTDSDTQNNCSDSSSERRRHLLDSQPPSYTTVAIEIQNSANRTRQSDNRTVIGRTSSDSQHRTDHESNSRAGDSDRCYEIVVYSGWI